MNITLLATCVGFVGCAPDRRVNLDEFLAIQQAARELPPAPALAPGGLNKVDQFLGPYTIGPSDVLDISLTGLEQPTATNAYRVRVDPKGEVDLPMVGTVRLLGLELAQGEDAIKTAYVPNVVRQLTVHASVVEYDPTDVVVTGSVTKPGMVSLKRSERNLLHAVLAAGGISESSSGSVTLRRVRKPDESLTFNLTDPVQMEASLEIDPLEDGDIVVVGPAMPNAIFVGGLVNRPAPQTYPAGVGMTVLQVLASAGGLREDVYPSEGLLIRRMPDGSDVRVKLDIPRIQRGEDENFVLAAGDVLWVPETAGTKLLDFFNRNLFIRGGATITYNASATEFLNSNARAESRAGQSGGGLQDSFDPFGFLNQNAALNQLAAPQRAAR